MILSALGYIPVFKMETTVRKGRKRLRNPDSWERNERKRLKASGEEHVDSEGRTVEKRTVKAITCRCGKECRRKVSSEEAERICKAFYETGSYQQQNIYLLGLINVMPVARTRVEKNSRRQHSFQYSLRLLDGNCVPVCRNTFCAVHAINPFECCKKS